MLKIRLKRTGKRGQAFFRVVVMESTRNRGSKSVEDIGYYNPHNNSIFEVDKTKAKKWLDNGAQPTETVAQYFVKQGLMKTSRKEGSTKSKGAVKKKATKEA